MTCDPKQPGDRWSESASVSAPDWLIGGGEMGELVRAMDWSKTPLGPRAVWPQTLRTTVTLCLSSNFAISLAWGPGRVQIYNDAYRRFCAIKHPSSLGQDFKECWLSAWPAIGDAFDHATGGEAHSIEDQGMFLDRLGYLEETFFTFSFSPIRDESGQIAGIFHPVHELTQQHLAERRLGIVRSLVDQTDGTQTVAAVHAAVGRVLANHALDLPFALLYSTDPMVGDAALIGHAGLEPGSPVAPLRASLDRETPGHWPLSAVLTAGQHVDVDEPFPEATPSTVGPYPERPRTAVVMSLAFTGDSLPLAFLVAGVSARRPLDQPYRAFYVLLADAIGKALAIARGHEIERARVEALAELDRAKTLFFTNVSHEFRTPLTLILGPLDEALHTLAEPTPLRETLKVVHRNAMRLLKLVNVILDYSRIEAGRVLANFQVIDVATFTAELASSFRSAAAHAGIELEVACDPTTPPVHLDPEMWEKIVLNLLSNAFKFTLKGKIAVQLTHGAEGISLAITDTGSGIPAADIPRVFERFHRVRSTASRSHEGTGIGLALTQELVRLHAGSIRVESQEARGSRFTVTLPYGQAHLPAAQVGYRHQTIGSTRTCQEFLSEVANWLPARNPAPSPESRHRARVLLADDNSDMREYIARLLRSRWDVTEVADGAAALEEVRREVPDLILADVMMPQMDGIELISHLKAHRATATVPVILLSALAGEEPSVRGLKAGANDYLVKPFSGKELVGRVAVHLELARVRREADEAVRRNQLEVQDAQRLATVSKLTAGIAHTYNNLLTAIIGYTSLSLDDSGTPADNWQNLTEALNAAHRASELTCQLLAYGQMQMLHPVRLELGALIREFEPELRQLVGPSVSLRMRLAPDLPEVLADRKQVHVILRHLLDNARNASVAGYATVAAEAVQVTHPLAGDGSAVPAGRYLKLSVSDQGRGISMADQRRIFDPFFTTKHVSEGAGLGLSVVLGIVRQSGGHVQVQSEVGAGTTFAIYLPLAANALPHARAPEWIGK